MVIMNMYSFIYMIPQGYSYAASALVGFHLAENKTKTAKREYSHSTIFFSVQGLSYELDFIRNDR